MLERGGERAPVLRGGLRSPGPLEGQRGEECVIWLSGLLTRSPVASECALPVASPSSRDSGFYRRVRRVQLLSPGPLCCNLSSASLVLALVIDTCLDSRQIVLCLQFLSHVLEYGSKSLKGQGTKRAVAGFVLRMASIYAKSCPRRQVWFLPLPPR